LRSAASYRLVMPEGELPGVRDLLAWLHKQAEVFSRERDAWLASWPAQVQRP